MTASAPIRSNTLAAYYRQQADVCYRMAKEALSPYDDEWLRIAAKWTRLARQAEVKLEATAIADKSRLLHSSEISESSLIHALTEPAVRPAT